MHCTRGPIDKSSGQKIYFHLSISLPFFLKISLIMLKIVFLHEGSSFVQILLDFEYVPIRNAIN